MTGIFFDTHCCINMSGLFWRYTRNFAPHTQKISHPGHATSFEKWSNHSAHPTCTVSVAIRSGSWKTSRRSFFRHSSTFSILEWLLRLSRWMFARSFNQSEQLPAGTDYTAYGKDEQHPHCTHRSRPYVLHLVLWWSRSENHNATSKRMFNPCPPHLTRCINACIRFFTSEQRWLPVKFQRRLATKGKDFESVLNFNRSRSTTLG